jgi:hypothetical protein
MPPSTRPSGDDHRGGFHQNWRKPGRSRPRPGSGATLLAVPRRYRQQVHGRNARAAGCPSLRYRNRNCVPFSMLWPALVAAMLPTRPVGELLVDPARKSNELEIQAPPENRQLGHKAGLGTLTKTRFSYGTTFRCSGALPISAMTEFRYQAPERLLPRSPILPSPSAAPSFRRAGVRRGCGLRLGDHP